jgi:NADPH2:quinone reductase
MLRVRAVVSPGEVVLVLGAAGAVGMAAVQLAKHLGARVLAGASSSRKLEVAKQFGADELIDYSTSNFADEVMRLTGGRGADVVVDHIGAETWAHSIRSLAPNGRLIMCGATTGHALQMDARQLWRRNISLLFSNSGTTRDLNEVVELWQQGVIRPLVAKVFPLEEAASAHRMLAERSTIGKVIVRVSAE